MFRPRAGLVVDERDCALLLVSFERKVLGHHLVGNISTSIGRVVVASADAPESADHLETNPIEHDGRAQRWTSRKEIAGHFVAQDDHVALLSAVQIVDPAPLLERKKADLTVLRLNAGNLSAGAGELTDRAHVVTSQDWRSIADIGGRTNVEVVLIGQQVLAGGAHAALHDRSAAGEDEHDVLAEFFHLPLVAGAEPFAQADQQQQRSDSPCNAKHRQERTELMRPEGAEDLREDIG